MSVRTYYLGDLAGAVDYRFGPILGQQQLLQNVGALIKLIQSVEPETWDVNGGPGTVVFDPARMVLIIKQSAELHSVLGGY
jgi:hypothetical protein